MSTLRTIRSFSTELMKVAAEIQDADIRRLLSERRGEEYLVGGKLHSNAMMEGNEYAQKMAGYSRFQNPAGFARGTGALDVLTPKREEKNTYDKVRDYAGTGLKGGLTGLGILGASNAMRGHFGSPVGHAATRKAMHSARLAFAGGAGFAIADRAARSKDKTAFVVSPNAGSSFKSPAESLTHSSQTGSFKPSVIHDTGTAPKSLSLGKKFQLP